MEASINLVTASMGESFERDFLGESQVIVRREGYSRARHIFTIGDRTIGRLRWQGSRRAVYETEGIRYEINVGALKKRISIISEDGSESFLIERASANPHREELRIEMAEGDNFRLMRSWSSRFRSEASLLVHKEFYTSTLLAFHFDLRRRTQTTCRVEVQPNLRWEARFTHRLLALIACRIILERRHSGRQPLRVKEKPRRFSSSARVRNRK